MEEESAVIVEDGRREHSIMIGQSEHADLQTVCFRSPTW